MRVTTATCEAAGKAAGDTGEVSAAPPDGRTRDTGAAGKAAPGDGAQAVGRPVGK